MPMRQPTVRLAVPCVLALFAAGCLNPSRGHQRAAERKRAFMPMAAAAAPLAAAPRFAPVKVRSFRALPPFDASGFVVRRAGGEFAVDYYNGWVALPQDLLRVQTARYLEQTGLFRAVYDGASATLPALGLEGVIGELCLDCSGEKPAAVVTLRLLVLDERAPAFTVLFSSERRGRAEVEESSGPAPAFGLALTRALEALARDLAEASLPQP